MNDARCGAEVVWPSGRCTLPPGHDESAHACDTVPEPLVPLEQALIGHIDRARRVRIAMTLSLAVHAATGVGFALAVGHLIYGT